MQVTVTQEIINATVTVDNVTIPVTLVNNVNTISVTIAESSNDYVARQDLEEHKNSNNPHGVIEDRYFEIAVNTPATSVNVPHNMGKYPSLWLRDSAGDVWVLDVNHIDKNNAIAISANPITGLIFCN